MTSVHPRASGLRRLAAICGILLAAGLFDTALATRAAAGRAAAVDDLARELFEVARLPSLSIAILRDGEIVYARAWGSADLEAGTPATTGTRYRCASVSKVLTVTALGRLVEDGRIDLDAPVSRYVPSWPSEPVVTPRQLAGHLSGVAHYQPGDRIDRGHHYESVAEALDVFRESPRVGPPGAQYAYSTHGFTLLSAVIEGGAGAPFLEVLETEVFAPLGMSSSGPDLRAAPHADMSTLYGRHGTEAVPIERPEDPSYKWAGGGLVSTPSDLVRLADAYVAGFLSPQVVDEMWTTQTTADGEETGVGIAWRIGEDPNGRRVIHHSGSMGGARSTVAVWPDEGEAIAIMTNITWPSDIHPTAMWLMEAYRRGEAGPVRPSIVTGGQRAYAGTFGDDPAAGRLVLGPDESWISIPEPFEEWSDGLFVDRMPLHHLDGSRYLLVASWGIYGVEIAEAEGVVRGSGRFGSNVWSFEAPPAGR